MAFHSPLIFIVVVFAILAIASVVGIYYYTALSTGQAKSKSSGGVCDNLKSNSAPGVSNQTASGSTATFTIIESDTGPYEGMNGSASHLSTPWPLMIVHEGQKVVIHVYNCASSEAHGFAINHYFNLGVTVHEGQSYVETFVANEVGNYTVYCNVFCAIHPLMQNGRLWVRP